MTRFRLIPLLLCSIFVMQPAHAVASEPILCTEPESVSDDIAPFSVFTHLVSDPYGRLHLVWNSGVAEGRNEQQVETDTVFYAFHDGEQWSQPVDILTAPDHASSQSIALTQDDHLLVTWHFRQGQRRGLRVSRAPLAQAGSAHGWGTVDLFTTDARSSDLFVDQTGRVHLAYVVFEPAGGIGNNGYAWSDDHGQSWSSEVRFALFDPGAAMNAGIRVRADGMGIVQAVWMQHSAEHNWISSGVWYARSVDGGETWSDPESVFAGERVAYPNLSLSGDGQRLYMTWLRGVGFSDSKYYRVSEDGGLSWGEPQLLFAGLQGLNGPMSLLADATGSEFFIMAGDTEGATKILYSQRPAHGNWSPPESISGELVSCEFPQATIVNGNQLHVVWNDFVEDDIYSVSCLLDAPAIPPRSTPTRTPFDSPTPTSTPASGPSVATPTPTTAPPAISGTDTESSPSGGFNFLIAGVAPVLVLIGLVIVWRLRTR
jgi:hypothetical protein